MKILEIVNNFKEHIPSITTTDGNPFPYQVHKIHKKQTNRNLNYLIDCNTIADWKLEFNHEKNDSYRRTNDCQQ